MVNKKVLAGLILIIFAIFIYSILHDISNLHIFKSINSKSFFEIYRNFQHGTLITLKKFPFFKFIKNYLVDLLWFSSFSLIFTQILPASKKVKFIFLILMAILSEFSQLFFKTLGTFDILDFVLYLSIAFIYLSTNTDSKHT